VDQSYRSNLLSSWRPRIASDVFSSTKVSVCPVYFPRRNLRSALADRQNVPQSRTSYAVHLATDDHTRVAELCPYDAAPLNVGVDITSPARWGAWISWTSGLPLLRRVCRTIRLKRVTIVCLRPLSCIHIIPGHKRSRSGRDQNETSYGSA